jgi:two-component system, NtrC family, nitrogen regulation sensor histidine kinase NtrY
MREGVARSIADFASAFAVALPPALAAIWIVVRGETSPGAWVAVAIALGASAVLVGWTRSGLARRLGTVSSVLAAFREGDFSIRARATRRDALLHDVLRELNGLGDSMREQRLGEMEAWALLRKVMAEIDVVVVALSEDRHVRLANDAAARALGKPALELMGKAAKVLGLAELLDGDAPRIVKDSAALGAGPWELRRGTFRLSGEPHVLLVLSDVSGALREQEREAWKRLIRVMGHEINNSLAPIKSISESLVNVLARSPRPADWEEDVTSGLSVVGRRAEGLSRFMTAYAQLARLPPPQLKSVDVTRWVERTVKLEQRLGIAIVGGPEVSIQGDADQLDQLLINLFNNAVDATIERGEGGGVRVRWSTEEGQLRLVIEDDGPGVSETANLFVPFFTTKPGGSGIGLALARQIAEAHGGAASLRTKPGSTGAEAIVRLPL